MTPSRHALVVLAVLIAIDAAAAHDAPSGWTYPLECCYPGECEQVSSDRVKITQATDGSGPGYLLDGKWWFPVTPRPSLSLNVRPSEDEHFHACWRYRTNHDNYGPRCFFAPTLTQ